MKHLKRAQQSACQGSLSLRSTASLANLLNCRRAGSNLALRSTSSWHQNHCRRDSKWGTRAAQAGFKGCTSQKQGARRRAISCHGLFIRSALLALLSTSAPSLCAPAPPDAGWLQGVTGMKPWQVPCGTPQDEPRFEDCRPSLQLGQLPCCATPGHSCPCLRAANSRKLHQQQRPDTPWVRCWGNPFAVLHTCKATFVVAGSTTKGPASAGCISATTKWETCSADESA